MDFDKRPKLKDLNPLVVKCCAGLPVYRLKEVTNDDWEMVQGNGKTDISVVVGAIIQLHTYIKLRLQENFFRSMITWVCTRNCFSSCSKYCLMCESLVNKK